MLQCKLRRRCGSRSGCGYLMGALMWFCCKSRRGWASPSRVIGEFGEKISCVVEVGSRRCKSRQNASRGGGGLKHPMRSCIPADDAPKDLDS